MKQFFYTRYEKLPSEGGEEKSMIPFTDSFNVDKVIRTIELSDGRRVVVLDDIHDRSVDVPITNKSGKVTGSSRQRQTFQSEIYLSPEDSKRFVDLR